jgi:hypothetical protein
VFAKGERSAGLTAHAARLTAYVEGLTAHTVRLAEHVVGLTERDLTDL